MNCITTYTGRVIDPFNIAPSDIDIVDIIHALPLLCRFNGHCRGFYSVAQHSVLVSESLDAICKQRIDHRPARWGLLHDAAEIYLSDIPAPLKASMPEIESAEQHILMAIGEKFELNWPIPQLVLNADKVALATEWRDLRNGHPVPPSILHIERWTEPIVALWPHEAKRLFEQRCADLGLLN